MPSNPLVDVVPAQYRKYVYSVIAAAAFLYSLWQLAGGDWKAFAAALLASLVPATAASNTKPKGK